MPGHAAKADCLAGSSEAEGVFLGGRGGNPRIGCRAHMISVLRTVSLGMALLLLSGGCRDEQAGPKPRAQTMPPRGSGGGRLLDSAPADLTFRSGATWGNGAIRYLGSRVSPPNARGGQTVQLTHYFQALAPPPQGFQLFVHLIDPQSGQMLANADHEIQQGAAPLGSWPVGKVIEDAHAVSLPPHAGTVRVVLGFWRGDQRLPVDDAAAHDGQQRMLGPTLGGAEQRLPEYAVARAAAPPTIDGDLGDPVWKSAVPVELVGSFDGRQPTLRTTARLAYDAENLYLAFDCEDPDVWGNLTAHDAPIYNEEVVEVFLDANGDGRSYNELQVSPNNVTFDASVVARRSDLPTAMRWESGMKSGVKVIGTVNDPGDRDQGWTAEMQIPISGLAEVPGKPPKPGDRWRFNLYRLEHLRRRQVEGQAFSPLYVGDFHHLPRFGWLVFQ